MLAEPVMVPFSASVNSWAARLEAGWNKLRNFKEDGIKLVITKKPTILAEAMYVAILTFLSLVENSSRNGWNILGLNCTLQVSSLVCFIEEYL
jgi:hypothetical protein